MRHTKGILAPYPLAHLKNLDHFHPRYCWKLFELAFVNPFLCFYFTSVNYGIKQFNI